LSCEAVGVLPSELWQLIKRDSTPLAKGLEIAIESLEVLTGQ